MVKTLCFQCRGTGSNPGQEAKIPHAPKPKNQNRNQKQHCDKSNKDFENGPNKKFLKKNTNPVYLVTSVTCGRNLDPGSCPQNRGGCFQVRQPLNSRVLNALPLCCPQMLSSVCVFATPWTVACQAPLSMGLPREKYRGGLPLPSPGDLPHPGIEPASPVSPASAGGVFTTSVTWEAHTSQRKLTDTKE